MLIAGDCLVLAAMVFAAAARHASIGDDASVRALLGALLFMLSDSVLAWRRFRGRFRGAQALILTAKAVALLDGRGHVAFADVARVAPPVLRHRVIRSFEGEAEGIAVDRVLAELLETVPSRPEGVERAVREAG